MTKFVYCVFQEAMRIYIPVDVPERAHVWPVMNDSVNTLGRELKEKTDKTKTHPSFEPEHIKLNFPYCCFSVH